MSFARTARGRAPQFAREKGFQGLAQGFGPPAPGAQSAVQQTGTLPQATGRPAATQGSGIGTAMVSQGIALGHGDKGGCQSPEIGGLQGQGERLPALRREG